MDHIINKKNNLIITPQLKKIIENNFDWFSGADSKQIYSNLDNLLIYLYPNSSKISLKLTKSTIDKSINLSKTIFPDKNHRPFYHDFFGHPLYTLIDIFKLLKATSKRQFVELNLYEIKVLIIATIFHEVDDWWKKGTKSKDFKKYNIKLIKFFKNQNLNPDDIFILIYLTDFSKNFNELINIIPKNSKISKKKFVLLGRILRCADFLQCLNDEYLKVLDIQYYDVNNELKTRKILAGSISLAFEFAKFKPKALEFFGWGTKDILYWEKIGPSKLFYKKYFYKNIKYFMKDLMRYYPDFNTKIDKFKKFII